MTEDNPTRREFDALSGRVGVLENYVSILREDVAEIKGILPNLATKADMAEMGEKLSAKIDTAVNGLLKDALQAVPQKVTIALTSVSVIMAIIATILGFLKFAH